MKIVCSIGPNVKELRDLDNFIKAGMDYMRLNFSHANYDKFGKQIKYVKEKFHHITIIQDLQGNKLRISNLFKGQLRVKAGDVVYFCSEEFYINNPQYNKNKILIPVAITGEFSWINNSRKILMKDGTMEFEIIGRFDDKETIKTKVVIGGMVRGEKGLNAPGIDRNFMSLTRKDKRDIEFGLLKDVDVICLSYVTCKENIEELKAYLQEIKKSNAQVNIPKIWAKIECREGVDNFDEILELVDGIMLGRGDLLSEIDIMEIPFVQDEIIKKMKDSQKELIIATYVLDSMKASKLPKIPEVDDLYSFIKNKVDGVMLAGEVGIGKNPIKTIEFTKSFIDKYN